MESSPHMFQMTSENDKVNNLFFSKEAEKVVQLKECKRKEVLKLYEHNHDSLPVNVFHTMSEI